MDQFNYPFMQSLPDHITYHRTCCRSKSPCKTTEEPENITHGIGDCKVSGAVMLDQDIKKFPTDDTDGMLCN